MDHFNKISRTLPRKIIISIRLFIILIVSLILIYIGIFAKQPFPLVIGLALVWIPFYTSSILKAIEVSYNSKLVMIGKSAVLYRDIRSIKKKSLNFLQKAFWAVQLNRVFIGPWEMFDIEYVENAKLHKKYFAIDPLMKIELTKFIKFASSNNSEIIVFNNDKS